MGLSDNLGNATIPWFIMFAIPKCSDNLHCIIPVTRKNHVRKGSHLKHCRIIPFTIQTGKLAMIANQSHAEGFSKSKPTLHIYIFIII